jgi:vacuolar-type H+-ATPase subunit E/Vma4
MTTNERLASLEAKLEILKELLKEIRDDVKDQPSREEYTDLKNRVDKLETNQLSSMIKVGTIAGILGILSGFIANYLTKLAG